MSEKNDIREIKKTADELAAKLEKGEMKLLTPIRGGGKDIEALKYDFTKLTAWEYAEAMDSDAAAKDAFKMTKKQGIALFAAAVAKEMPELDARDVKERLGIKDGVQAVNLATVFFVSAQRAEH